MMAELLKDNQVRVELQASRTKEARLFSSFEYGENLNFSLVFGDFALAQNAVMQLVRDEDGEELYIQGTKIGNRFDFPIDTARICPESEQRGLFYYLFFLDNRVLSQNEFGFGMYISDSAKDCSRFQLSVYQQGTNRPTGKEGGILYQSFPDRFCKSDLSFTKEGAVLEEDWYANIREYAEKPGDPVKNNHFFGGDLYGVASRLEYLESLGVTMLYLNPIFKAASNHRYDTGDYSQVDELLGGEEGLRYLLEVCRDYGIEVILDGVFNHTGADSLYFNKEGRYPSVGAYQSKTSPYFDWYTFKEFPDSYDCWWGIKILPKVNFRNESYRNFIAGKDGILEKYMKMGVAGWRLDVADELSDEMLDAIRQRVAQNDPCAPVFGEVWEDASNKIAYSQRRHYFTGGQLTSVMNYPLKNAIIAFLSERDAEFLFFTMRILYSHYPKAVSDMQMNLLSTHDTERILTVLAGSPQGNEDNAVLSAARLSEEERRNAKRLLKLAVILQMFLPGIPCIYYGDEIGMEGYRDPFNRQTYKWGQEDEEVLAFYRKVTKLRRSLLLLADAYYEGCSCENGLFVFRRFDDRQTLTVAVNRSEEERGFEAPMESCSLFRQVTGRRFTVEPDGFEVVLSLE